MLAVYWKLGELMREVWFVDFEYHCPEGEIPLPLCLVAHEAHSGQWIRLSRGEFPDKPPYCATPDSVFVSFAADAELSCHYALGWPFPHNVIDLHAEYLNYSNCLERAGKPEDKLFHALTHFRIPHISSAEKERMQRIAIEGGPRSVEEAA